MKMIMKRKQYFARFFRIGNMLQNRLRVVRCDIMPGSGDKWRALTVPKLFRPGISSAPAGEVKVICCRITPGARRAWPAHGVSCTRYMYEKSVYRNNIILYVLIPMHIECYQIWGGGNIYLYYNIYNISTFVISSRRMFA